MKFKRYWVVTLDYKNNLAKRDGFNGQHRIVICGEFLKPEDVLTQLKEFMARAGRLLMGKSVFVFYI